MRARVNLMESNKYFLMKDRDTALLCRLKAKHAWISNIAVDFREMSILNFYRYDVFVVSIKIRVLASLSGNNSSRVMYQRDTRVCFSALEGIWCTFWLALGSVVGKKSEIRSAFLQNKCLAALEMEGRTCQAFGFNLHCKNRAATVVGNKL